MYVLFHQSLRLGLILFFGLILLYIKVWPNPAMDLDVFVVAARHAYWLPEQIYSHNRDYFLYPPQAAWLFIPFIFSPSQDLTKIIWFFFNLGIIFTLVRFSWIRFAALFFLSRYLVINLYYGQVNVLILGLAVLIQNLSFHRLFWIAPILLSISSTLKIFPALQSLDWILKKDWKRFSIFVGSLLVIFSLPFWIYGWDLAISLYQQLPAQLANKNLTLYSHNQSIQAFLARFFTDHSFHLFSVEKVQWTLIALPILVVKILALGLGGGLSWLVWKKAMNRKHHWDPLSAFFMSFLFLSPLVWKPYLIFLFPVWVQLFESYQKDIFKTWQFWSFTIITLILTPDIIGFPLASRLDAICIHLIGAIITMHLWIKFSKK